MKEGEERGDYSMFVFISRCSINCTLSVNPARIFASSFSIFSICASDESFWVDVTCGFHTVSKISRKYCTIRD